MTKLRELMHQYCVVGSAPRKYIYYTTVDTDTLLLRVTDGRSVWKLDLNPPEMEIQRQDAGVEMEQFLKLIKDSLESEENKIVSADDICTLTTDPKTNSLKFKLFKADEFETKKALCDVLFFLAEKSKDLQNQLEKATTTIQNLKQPTKHDTMFDLNDAKSGKSPLKVEPKRPGMSVINPGSKKKKVPRGVEFD